MLLTFLGTLLCFSVSLLLAIVAMTVIAAVRGSHPDMRIAYRHFAVPLAVIEGSVILVLSTALEVRHYIQRRALAALERMS